MRAATRRLRAVHGGRHEAPDGFFGLVFLDADGNEVDTALSQAAAAPLEWSSPVRSFPSYRGQRNYPGYYFAASMERHDVAEHGSDGVVMSARLCRAENGRPRKRANSTATIRAVAAGGTVM